MKKIIIIVSLFIFMTPISIQAAEGFFLAYGYSYNPKKAYFSNVFSTKVKGKSYSDTEYVADVDLMYEIEEKFREALFEIESLVTVIVLGPYKTKEFSKQKLSDERESFKLKKFEIIDLGFNFK